MYSRYCLTVVSDAMGENLTGIQSFFKILFSLWNSEKINPSYSLWCVGVEVDTLSCEKACAGALHTEWSSISPCAELVGR